MGNLHAYKNHRVSSRVNTVRRKSREKEKKMGNKQWEDESMGQQLQKDIKGEIVEDDSRMENIKR